jgi:hypothetical protein
MLKKILTLLILLTFNQKALACKCLAKDLKTTFEDSKFGFIGKIGINYIHKNQKYYQFKIIKQLKSPSEQKVLKIYFSKRGCGAKLKSYFKVDEKYLLMFNEIKDGFVYVSNCNFRMHLTKDTITDNTFFKILEMSASYIDELRLKSIDTTYKMKRTQKQITPQFEEDKKKLKSRFQDSIEKFHSKPVQ